MRSFIRRSTHDSRDRSRRCVANGCLRLRKSGGIWAHGFAKLGDAKRDQAREADAWLKKHTMK
jgi:hypothetical protein